jgi:hypothetical protein
MATDSAPPRDRTRRLWQVPTFLVGLAALVALWHSGDRLRPSVSERYKRALLALKPAVDRSPADVDQINSALRRLPAADPPAEMLTLTRYLVGSAHVALAEANPGGPEAADHWATARKNLEPASTDESLPPADVKKLRYRLGRVWANTPGTDPARTIETLTKYLPDGDNPAEGHRLLVELHLAATPPNEALARDNLREFLTHAPTRADARTLNQARLRLGELHAKFGERDEARQVLERVGPDAPPEVYAGARLLLARQKQEAEDWAGAAKLWEQVRDMRAATDAQRGEAQVRLAEAYTRLGRPADAERAASGLAKSDGPTGRAGAFRLAEAKLKEPGALPESVAQALETAFAGGEPADLRSLISATDAKRVCTAAFTKAKAAGDFPLALRVVKAYAAVAEKGHHYVLTAEAQTAWAAISLPDEANGHYTAAADAWTAAAAAESDPVQAGEALRRAAELQTKGGSPAKALAILGQLSAKLSAYPADRAGAAWTDLGDAYLAAGDKAQARAAFQTAADRPGPTAAKARVRLAGLLVETEPAQAASLLKDIAEAPAGDDPATHEAAVYGLGEALLMQRQWTLAEARLRSALQAYPASPRAPRARYQFAQVFRQRASVEARKIEAGWDEIAKFDAERLQTRDARKHVSEQARIEDRITQAKKTFFELLQTAYDEFRKAEELLLAAKDPDPVVVKKTTFWAADCAYWLGLFEDSARRYEKLAVRYQGKVEELEALEGLHRTCAQAAADTREKDPARRMEAQKQWSQRASAAYQGITRVLDSLAETEFDGTTEKKRKAYWSQWVGENKPRPAGG